MSPAIRHQIEMISSRVSQRAKFDEDVMYQRTQEISNMLIEKFEQLAADRSDREAEADLIAWFGAEDQVAADLKDPLWIRVFFYKAHNGTRLGWILLAPILFNFIYAIVLGFPNGEFSWGMTNLGMKWMPLLVMMLILARIQRGIRRKAGALRLLCLSGFLFYVFNDAQVWASRVLLVGTFQNWGLALLSVALMQAAAIFRCIAWLLLLIECVFPDRQSLLRTVKSWREGRFDMRLWRIRKIIGV